jgi:hypothetical protein
VLQWALGLPRVATPVTDQYPLSATPGASSAAGCSRLVECHYCHPKPENGVVVRPNHTQLTVARFWRSGGRLHRIEIKTWNYLA